MLRLIHAQTVQGALLVDDLDDGLPNKEIHRMGSTADPKAYERDGYANSPKQPCYVPRVKPTDATLPGYIDLDETRRVIHSSAKGKIYGLKKAGLLTVVSFVAADLAKPNISGTTLGAPGAGDVTIAGTGFLSVSPNITSVHLVGAGVGDVTLTATQIVGTAPGAITDTQIIIAAALIAGLAGGDHITVHADDQDSNTATV